ncbi:MAG: hypothetical protein HOL98_09730 [Gammaproteobacteria bacterium]|jgi:hypothetical protein|nr:hypothetical protein [Gammaproteobacteria bacterium]MBT5203721.1 hypothetical protein [Gammaproteobacteria bacterium]MBT5601766.1 hypothetical protein [Gammaproteobacteria bacterium]MBT6244131.1 hypothetical protein [Gammaproteobacteria bacterium]
MKVFVPVPNESSLNSSELKGQFVPFHPDYLEHSVASKQSRKPLNWLEKTDYTTACERLSASFGAA